ncbi:oxygen tolerance protein BatD [Dysgonomonas alginatilytica]|uniref:Oxygen tolerance protein BatD n=1 Tax=Dysgonomonas alginatilytica TaxID=1605892 RepID=A0A2V3PPR3_9BACT|nr:BatD family protein [Dysgonomonas alginatilytica]PXV58476.1 oxygen tolerance protein BatD [Dysgonomonas alginatilytica]
MKEYCCILILLLIGITNVHAQDVSFILNAPTSVVKGAQFQLQYILRGGSGADIDIPEDIKGFDVLYGPSVSEVYSSSNINNKVTSESNVTYTYLVMAREEGIFNLPAASIKVGSSNYKSNIKQIKVLPPDKNLQPGQPITLTTSSSTAEDIDSNDAFVSVIISKTRVKEQEAITVIFRFYTALEIRSIDNIQVSECEGFVPEDFQLPANRQMSLEHYNGRNYYTLDVKKTLLFPQRSGMLTIPSCKMEIVFSVPSGEKVTTFFGPQDVMIEAKKTLTTSPVTIDVIIDSDADEKTVKNNLEIQGFDKTYRDSIFKIN